MNESGYLRHILACNPPVEERFVPWFVEDQVVGWLRPWLVEKLAGRPDVFETDAAAVRLQNRLKGFAARTQALDDVVGWLAQEELITPPMGEPYPVTPAGREAALCVMDRSAAAYFGVRAFGQHLNGYVRREDGIHMWLGRRARDRLIFPGCLDNMVAGGLPWGVSLEQNLRKECAEEAGLSAELADQAVPTGLVSYNRVAERGYRPDVLYCYDLELSPDFVPQNTDGEVESFSLLPLDDVARLVRETDEFKLNCNLVIIDFLLRHGYLEPQHGEYLDLATGLRRPLGAGLSVQ
jgi:8-oxo-dGTP pyrophosphatase MutT (NUDIX family)